MFAFLLWGSQINTLDLQISHFLCESWGTHEPWLRIVSINYLHTHEDIIVESDLYVYLYDI